MSTNDAGEAGEEVLLSLGSNLGDRLGHLRSGVRELRSAVRVSAVSPVVESEAQGVEGEQPDFLNAVVRARTRFGPGEMLRACLAVEDREGRRRPHPGAPRTLDVDLLFQGRRIVRSDRLTVPHPRWKERGFVLRPLLEVAAEWRDPETGRTVEEICRERPELLKEVRTVAPSAALDDDERDPPYREEDV